MSRDIFLLYISPVVRYLYCFWFVAVNPGLENKIIYGTLCTDHTPPQTGQSFTSISGKMIVRPTIGFIYSGQYVDSPQKNLLSSQDYRYKLKAIQISHDISRSCRGSNPAPLHAACGVYFCLCAIAVNGYIYIYIYILNISENSTFTIHVFTF